MPLYFFHLRNGEDVLLDAEGRDLDGAEAIHLAALKEARAIISHDALNGSISLDQFIDVQDDRGKLADSLSFKDAVRISGLG